MLKLIEHNKVEVSYTTRCRCLRDLHSLGSKVTSHGTVKAKGEYSKL